MGDGGSFGRGVSDILSLLVYSYVLLWLVCNMIHSVTMFFLGFFL